MVVNAGSPVEMPWAAAAPALVWAWYGGQEVGNAVADVLLGVADPSGRLPTTFPRRLADVACHALADPRVYPGRDGKVVYAEGVFSGYRHFDAHGIAPRFPFGHGLSYARFEYGPLALSRARVRPGEAVEVRVELHNAGERAGTEVVQLYVADLAASVPRPPQELAAFAKVALAPGASETRRAARRAARALLLRRRAERLGRSSPASSSCAPGAPRARSARRRASCSRPSRGD